MAISTLGKRVLLRRRDLELTQVQLAEMVGISANTIARLERGRLQDLTGQTVAKLAEALKTSSDFILGLTDEEIEPAALAMV